MNKIESLYKYIETPNLKWEIIDKELLYSFIEKMKNTNQDKFFHQEGDVYIHTKMVCEELIKLPVYKTLPKKQKLELFLAALFHDVGKTLTTKIEEDHITSPHHGPTGSCLVREFFIKDLGISGKEEYLTFRETICSLIRYHTSPIFLGVDADERKIIKLSLLKDLTNDFTLEMLSLLSIADMKGRIGPNTDEKLFNIELFKEYAINLSCYRDSYKFSDNYTKYKYLNGTNILPNQSLYNDSNNEIILLVGLPGTGKDTFIKNNYPNSIVISLDDLRDKLKLKPTDNQGIVYTTAKELAKEYLRTNTPFIWNATNTTNLIRSKQIKLFHDYNATVKIIYLETTLENVLKRNKSRKKEVIENVIFDMLKTLTLPEPFEAESIQWICI